MNQIILASTSPRRKELLEWLELDFEIVPSHFDESSVVCDEVEELVEELALQKALSVAREYPDSIVIGADTMVSLNGEPIGKADDRAHAIEILQKLSGTHHQITSGVAIIDPLDDQPILFHDVSSVNFRQINQDEIDEYLKSDVWHDKAGAYAVQEDEGKFILGHDGSYTNIMGIPLKKLADELQRMGVDIHVDVIATIEANTGKRES